MKNTIWKIDPVAAILSIAFVLFMIVLLAVAAYSGKTEQSVQYEQKQLEFSRTYIPANLFYVKDYRTGICYALSTAFSNSKMMTSVPCSPEVEKLIIAK